LMILKRDIKKVALIYIYNSRRTLSWSVYIIDPQL